MRTTTRGRARSLVLGAVAAVALGACSEGSTGPSADVTPAAAEAIALFLLDIDATAGWSAEVLTDQRSGTREFSRTAPCPAGGARSLSGSGTSSFDAATRVLSTNWTTTQAHDDCAFEHHRGDQNVLVVIDGSVTVTGSASYQFPEDRSGSRSILSYSSHRIGSTTTTLGDRSRTCVVDVTESYDPGTETFRVVGVICGREVDVTRSRGQRRDG